MRSSGLIVAFVVALWAAYFVPLVLRRYDESSKNSALDAEGPLRRVVSSPRRKQAAPPVAKAAAMTTPSDPTVDAPAAEPAEPTRAAQQRPTQRRAAAVAARRRRRTLLTLVGLLVVTAVVAVAGLVPVWSPVLPVLLIAAWLVACRVQVRGERGLSGSGGKRHSVLSRVPVPSFASHRPKARPASAPRHPDEEDTVIVAIEDDPDHEHVMESSPLDEGELGEQLQIAVPSVSVTGEALWDPLPVTVPTYVSKPRVGRTVRTIDFSQGGAWTSGHVEGENTDYAPSQDHDGDQRKAVGH